MALGPRGLPAARQLLLRALPRRCHPGFPLPRPPPGLGAPLPVGRLPHPEADEREQQLRGLRAGGGNDRLAEVPGGVQAEEGVGVLLTGGDGGWRRRGLMVGAGGGMMVVLVVEGADGGVGEAGGDAVSGAGGDGGGCWRG